MAEDTTERLATFASQLTYDDIPDRVRGRCKELLLDALACALAGHLGEETPQLSALASALGQSHESTIIGGGQLSLAGATILNGYLIAAVTMSDVHRATATHITPVIVPPALAIAERESASGRDLLVALASGFETTTRIGIGLDYQAFLGNGWHGPGVIGPFGAAAAAGKLLGFAPDRMATAFGLAGSQAAGTYAAWGTPTVKFHQCRGALSGLLAALLAQQGFVATRQFLTAPRGGLYPTYCDGGHPEAVTAGLGERWELEQVALRLWPTSARTQGIVTAMFDLLEQYDLRPAQVSHLRIAMSNSAFDLHGGYANFSGKFEAMLSAHYAAAAVLHDHDLWLDQFEPARYNAPDLRRFASERVEVRSDPQLKDAQATVEVETVDGRTLRTRCDVPKGSPENPLTRAEIEQKLRKGARGQISPAAAEAVIDAVSHLEELDSIRSLMESLRSEDQGLWELKGTVRPTSESRSRFPA
ncbi:MAG: MmgE/PrpD family protein [Chloroflexota bacterium]